MKDVVPHHINYGGHHDPDEERQELLGCGCVFLLIFVLCIVGSLIGCMTSCTRTQYISNEVPVVLHDTLTTVRIQHDSIHNRDSVFVERYIVGDTVFVNKYAERWRTKVEMKYDTVTSSVEVPVEIVKEVPVYIEKPSQWKKVRSLVGWMLGLIGVIIATLLALRFGVLGRIATLIKVLVKR